MFLNFNLRNNHKIKESDKINDFKYSTWYINSLSLIISIIIVLILNISYKSNLNFKFLLSKTALKAGFSVNYENKDKMENNHSKFQEETKEELWYLEIPCIGLKANICEGTSKEVMDKFIGHFEESQIKIGNVCLAAHNRGYENNYFEKVKDLKQGDTIIYYYNNDKQEYIVEKNEIIQATDLSCLENTKENVITLITCVENEPNYRRCVKAIEKKY